MDQVGAAELWQGVDRLIDRAPSVADLRAHRLHLLAVRRWRALDRPLPPGLVDEERWAAIFTLAAQIVLEKARAAYDGPMVLLKGPVVAALYPDPALRPFRDLDILVPDAEEAQRRLIAAGFQPVGKEDSYYAERHHLQPLSWPGLPPEVEIHRRPEWPKWAPPPATEELLAAAETASVGVHGVLAPDPYHHTLIVVAHSWSDVPLRRALDVIDVAALAIGLDQGELRKLARSWGIGGAWEATRRTADALFYAGPTPLSMRIWARDLRRARDRTVLENHVRRLVSSFWALPPHKAVGLAGSRIVRTMQPAAGESWRQKVGRARLALRNAFTRLSEHDPLLHRQENPPSDPKRDRSK